MTDEADKSQIINEKNVTIKKKHHCQCQLIC